jgi:hypothetical protein
MDSARQKAHRKLELIRTGELAKQCFYSGCTFREVQSDPLFFISVTPLIVLYGVILMKREIVEEWRQLYNGLIATY